MLNTFALADITEHLGVEPLVDYRDGVVGKMNRLSPGRQSVSVGWDHIRLSLFVLLLVLWNDSQFASFPSNALSGIWSRSRLGLFVERARAIICARKKIEKKTRKKRKEIDLLLLALVSTIYFYFLFFYFI